MISKFTQDVITEMVNIGVAKGATMLATMMKTRVSLSVPEVKIIDCEKMQEYFEELEEKQIYSINFDFEDPSRGKALFVITDSHSTALASALTKIPENDPKLNEKKSDVLKEVGNIVLNSIITSISQFIYLPISLNVPKEYQGSYSGLHKIIEKEAETEKV
ncbi:MAG: chemotaxis protein CheC, partial [Cyclobacteriaceae bacterium]|nr:chemotaxis protein CheC [Cyclobacteriaceae bacterium]